MTALFSSYELVRVTVQILVVTLNRPPVNSLNLELLSDISNTLDDLESSKSRGMILTSVSKFLQFVLVRWFSLLPIPNPMYLQSSKTVFSAGLDITGKLRPSIKVELFILNPFLLTGRNV